MNIVGQLYSKAVLTGGKRMRQSAVEAVAKRKNRVRITEGSIVEAEEAMVREIEEVPDEAVGQLDEEIAINSHSPEPVILPDTKKVRKPMSPEARKRLSIALKQRFADPVLRAKMSEGAKNFWSSPEAREHNREAVKAWWTPERKAEQARKMREVFAAIKEMKGPVQQAADKE